MAQGRKRGLEQREKDLRALEARRRNLTYHQIAANLGYSSVSGAYAAVQRALEDSVREASDAVRQLELDRLDELARHMYRMLAARHVVVIQSGKDAGKLVTDDDTGLPLQDWAPVERAVARLQSISESRRRLLGLDAPVRTKVEVITRDQVEDAIMQLEAQIAQRERAAAEAAG